MIELTGVYKSFSEGSSKRKVLNGLDLKIVSGEIVVLFGKSGSGKSTLLNIISGIDLPDAGSVTIAKQNLTNLNENDRTLFRRNNIGFIFQFFNLIPTLTVIENLLLQIELKKGKLNSNRETADELLKYVGLSDRRDSYPDVLSGGEQQRIAIARALIHNPEIILADEPTGNLDFDTAGTVTDLLIELVKKKGRTLIIATHSREMANVADSIYLLRHGILAEQNLQSVNG